MIINKIIIIHKRILYYFQSSTMPCSICGSSLHNKRTCSSTSGATPSEIRVAKELSSLLPPVVTRRPLSRGGKPLEGLQGCMNIFKEPKASPPSPVRVHICSKCGVSGHNSRTCEAIPLKETIESSLNQRRCGMCGLYGHNRRSCEANTSAIQVKSKKTCSLCGQKGHNSRTCLHRCKPCGEGSLTRISEKITFADGVTRQIDLGIA